VENSGGGEQATIGGDSAVWDVHIVWGYREGRGSSGLMESGARKGRGGGRNVQVRGGWGADRVVHPQRGAGFGGWRREGEELV